MKLGWRAALALVATATAAGFAAAREPAAKHQGHVPPKVDLGAVATPDIATVPDTPEGRAIKYGYELVTATYAHIGPEVAQTEMRYAGNNLTCQSCHLQAGAQVYAMPYVGVWGAFPQYRARENEVSTLEERINGCMMRSMNGRPLPHDSREMKAMLAYMKWLSSGVPVGASLVGAGTLAITEPARAADPARGAAVYAETCAACHGENGLGLRNGRAGDAKGYQFPPLWGPDSYNTGAGMYRLLTAAAFIKNNMPVGTTHAAAALSDENAYDVAAFINSQPRPEKADLDKDFPDRRKKPVDAPFPPWIDGFGAAQHKYGPFEPIRRKLRELDAAAAGPKAP
ncbi:c-type cytochrome [Chelatococcus sp. SYSU_G07232]|uniref:C-type cytochrome n=1 Tax=Chelatococcus albus TaxID=3047466 RepID=A0ABT7AG63_9HYPH|nr:c-type cytochrome [Chelatococcus sp. SYSU_G07232]MDJ1158354.1 c-type cytochrome [Chelatococcus sp. SYSU_G07232]